MQQHRLCRYRLFVGVRALLLNTILGANQCTAIYGAWCHSRCLALRRSMIQYPSRFTCARAHWTTQSGAPHRAFFLNTLGLRGTIDALTLRNVHPDQGYVEQFKTFCLILRFLKSCPASFDDHSPAPESSQGDRHYGTNREAPHYRPLLGC